MGWMNVTECCAVLTCACRKAGSPVNTAGSTAILNCSDALYTQQIQNFFDALDAPAMYAPGAHTCRESQLQVLFSESQQVALLTRPGSDPTRVVSGWLVQPNGQLTGPVSDAPLVQT